MTQGLAMVARAALIALLSCSVVGCKGSSDKDAAMADLGAKDGRPDALPCKRPPLAQCEPPPYGSSCPSRYFCPGCNCTGQAPAAACDPITQDCRRFCTGCYPAEYIPCGPTAPPQILARCGYCFLSDAGPERCHTIGLDAGVPVDASATQ